MTDQFLTKFDLPSVLLDRTLCRVPPPDNDENHIQGKSFVLYLPTVVLRKRHNPGFALACRIANYYKVPVLVLCTVLDDQHLTRRPHRPVCMTARRLAFTLEALQHCAPEFAAVGAGVAIRVHGPSCKIPHHLTLSHKALCVITDEPFVEPFRCLMRKVVGTCKAAKVPCFTVDGSTTVPPKSKLRLSPKQLLDHDLSFQGVPSKAWMWEKQTSPYRKSQVHAAVQDGCFDAPALICKLPIDFFLLQPTVTKENSDHAARLFHVLPSEWKCRETPSPGTRPWTVEELSAISNIKEWTMTSWPGADRSVPPCRQTHGSLVAAQQRWEAFLNEGGLALYAKRRNQVTSPHAVSRMSCYLNLGILSIFDLVADVWKAQGTMSACSEGCHKFLDEVIKWREVGYAHTFAFPGYHGASVIPQWSQVYLQGLLQNNGERGYSYEQLETACTKDAIWNAMQSYLVETGELHNHARMTWGKTLVHWQATIAHPEEVLWQLCCLNDRYALDGLSPPSYAGILWCFGWCDKPGPAGSVTTKWAYHYQKGPDDFNQAKFLLYNGIPASPSSVAAGNVSLLNKGNIQGDYPSKKTRLGTRKDSTKGILEYFSPVSSSSSTTRGRHTQTS